MSQFHFLRPYFILLLIPYGIIMWQLLRQSRGGEVWRDACDAHLLPHLLQKVGRGQNYLPTILLNVAMLLAIVALAGPTWSRSPLPVYRSLASRVIVLDLSPSMFAKDIKPDRLSRAKFKALDILQRTAEGQVGMVVFSRVAFVVSPLTEDAATIAAMMPQLNPNIMPVEGSNIASGLKTAAQLIKQGGLGHGQIILISSSHVTVTDVAVAKKLEQQGIDTSVLAIGTSRGAPIPTSRGFLKNRAGTDVISKLDSAGLQRLAKVGGGHYARFSNDDRDINSLLTRPRQHLQLKAEKTKEKTQNWRDAGRYLVLSLLPLAALGFRRGWFEALL